MDRYVYDPDHARKRRPVRPGCSAYLAPEHAELVAEMAASMLTDVYRILERAMPRGADHSQQAVAIRRMLDVVSRAEYDTAVSALYARDDFRLNSTD